MSITFLTFIHLANIREVPPNIFVALLNQLKKGRMLNFTLKTIANAQLNKLLFFVTILFKDYFFIRF